MRTKETLHQQIKKWRN